MAFYHFETNRSVVNLLENRNVQLSHAVAGSVGFTQATEKSHHKLHPFSSLEMIMEALPGRGKEATSVVILLVLF